MSGTEGGGSGYSQSQQPISPYGAQRGDYSASVPGAGSSRAYAPYTTPDPGNGRGSNSKPASRIFGNGINLQPSYQAGGEVDLGWSLMKPLSAIQTLRLEIEDFAVDAAARWIYEASTRGYTVIATYHSFKAIDHPSPADDAKHMARAIQFWNANYKKLAEAGPFIINVMNEWGHKTIGAKAYADQYNQAIAAIRSYYSGLLIIDLPGYGQLARVAADAVTGAGGITPIQDRNVVLSMHVYPQTWNGKGPLTVADLDLLAATGRPCMIGEFGESNEAPNTDWSAIVSYARLLSWPVFAWCWDGDGGVMNVMLPEFQPFVPGKTFPYYINARYENLVLPFLL